MPRFKGVCQSACSVCAFACVCACMSVCPPALARSALYSNWWLWRHQSLLPLLFSATKPQHLLSHQAQRGQASRAVGGGAEEGPPLLPFTPVLGWSMRSILPFHFIFKISITRFYTFKVFFNYFMNIYVFVSSTRLKSLREKKAIHLSFFFCNFLPVRRAVLGPLMIP